MVDYLAKLSRKAPNGGGERGPICRRQSLASSENVRLSGRGGSEHLQLAPAGLTEIAQQIHFRHQLGKLTKFSVRRLVKLRDSASCLLGLHHNCVARDHSHLGYERIDID